jgi:G protein-coupled receptor 158
MPTGHMLYRYNDTAYRNAVMETSIKIEYEDGHWSKPYFDCRGGDIWMMTYTVPFFGYRDNRYYFK